MNINKFFLITLCLLLWGSLQDSQAQKRHSKLKKDPKQEEINRIRKSTEYLSSMGNSMKDQDEARTEAYLLMEQSIVQWLREECKCQDVQGYVAKSKQKFESIPTRRGNLYRVFLYVRKQDILPLAKEDSLIQVGVHCESAVSGGRVEPVVQRPDLVQGSEKGTNVDRREPAVSDSVRVSGPAAGKVTLEASVPKSSQVSGQIAVVESTPASVQPVETGKDVEAVQRTAAIGIPSQGVASRSEEGVMRKKHAWGQLKPYIEQLNRQGRLQGFGNGCVQPASTCVYHFLLDYNQLVVRRLRWENGTWTDLRSGKTVPAEEVAACASKFRWVWITLKN